MLFRSDRKSTRLNSSHTIISYAVFCLKKKKKTIQPVWTRSPEPHHIRRTDAAAPPPSPPAVARPPDGPYHPPSGFRWFSFFFLMIRRPPRSTLFPYPTPSR